MIKKFYFSPLVILLTLTLLKGAVTALIVPIWEFPDEQAHFAQVSYFVETSSNIAPNNNLSREIYESEVAMGTLRDERGNNSYTYRPLYKPPYTNSIFGPKESYLTNLPFSFRKEYVPINEAPRYPPLFYHLASIGYRITYSSNLFIRIYATRAISVIITTASVYIAFRTGRLLTPKNQLFPLTLASLVSFHPMFSFVGSGVNNDNLANFLGFLILYLTLKLFTSGFKPQPSLGLLITFLLAKYVKPNVYPVFIPSIGYIAYLIYPKILPKKLSKIPFWVLLITALIIAILIYQPLVHFLKIPFLPLVSDQSPNKDLSFLSYIKPQIRHYYQETLVWYWGVFKWLGVILPRNLIRFLKLIMILSLFGLIKTWFDSKTPLIKQKNLVFLSIFSLSFLAIITFWDYQMIQSLGFSHGLQGRYFFPTLSTHMALLSSGLIALVPSKLRTLTQKVLVIFFIFAHTLSLQTLANAYYNTSSISIFLTQLSQYKPWFFKFPINIFWITLYAFLVLIFIFTLVFQKNSSSKFNSAS